MKKLFLIMALLLAVLIAGCGGGGDNEDDNGGNSGTAPTVTSVYPGNGAASVSTLPTITVTFSTAMNQTTTAGAFSMSPTVDNADIFWSADGKTMIVIPSTALSTSTLYTCTIGTGATDSSGNALESAYSWSWTTGSSTDATAPTVLSVTPANGATGVFASSIITVIFSEAMDQSSTEGAFSITLGVTGTFNWTTLNIMTFTPDSPLLSNTTYNCAVGTSATDSSAVNHLASAYSWSFTTVTSSDTTPPTVLSVTPVNGATGVNASSTITVTFSEVMNHTNAEGAFSMISSGGTDAVPGTFSWVGNVMTFTPTTALSANTIYDCVVDTTATDSAGNALASDYVWSFTTVDTIAPTIISVVPVNNATGVATLPTIEITFSEAMDTSSAETAFSISPSVNGTFIWNGNTMIFTPNGDLSTSTQYTCMVGTGAKDLAGNSLASAYSWKFTTRSAADTTAPTILLVAPANGAVNVAVLPAVTVTFSEAMNQGSAEGAFSMSSSGGPVSGSFTWDGNTMIFTPGSSLSTNTLYTCTVGTGAQDNSPAGNHLASAYSWSFTSHDTIVPYIVSVVPLNGATGVPRSRATTTIIVTFSEPMNKISAQTSFSVRMYSPKYSYHPENFSWSADGTVMTFTYKKPVAHKTWSANTTYICTESAGATDLTGLHLSPAPYTWSWKTGTGL